MQYNFNFFFIHSNTLQCTSTPEFQNSVYQKHFFLEWQIRFRVILTDRNSVLGSEPCSSQYIHHSFQNTVLEAASFGWLND